MVDGPSRGVGAGVVVRHVLLKLSKQVNQWPCGKYMFAAFLITFAVIPLSQRRAGTRVPAHVTIQTCHF